MNLARQLDIGSERPWGHRRRTPTCEVLARPRSLPPRRQPPAEFEQVASVGFL